MSQKVTNSLLNYLENGNEVDRCYAAKTLGNLKTREASSALVNRLRDDDIDVCIDAITALGKIRDSSVIPALLESLEKDPDGEVKLAITESLAHFHSKEGHSEESQSEEIIDVLLKLAEDRPEDMHFDENDDWDGWWDLQEKAIIILGKLKVSRAVPLLQSVLKDEFSQDIETIVLKALAKIGGEADQYLIERLNDGNEKQQRRVATALGYSTSNETLLALGRALVSQSADTRENTIMALGQRKASRYLRAILLSLRDPANNVKRAALDVIHILSEDSNASQNLDFNQIAQLLKENDATLQTSVLAFFFEQNKIAPFIDKLSDENQQLIRHCLTSRNDNVFSQAALLAGAIKDIQSCQQLIAIALSESHSVWARKEALSALGKLVSVLKNSAEEQEIISSLSQLISHKEQAVRFAAIEALLNISNNSTVNKDLCNFYNAEGSCIAEGSYNNTETKEPIPDFDNTPPLSILLATLRGEKIESITATDNAVTANYEPQAGENASNNTTNNPDNSKDNSGFNTNNHSSCAKNADCSNNTILTDTVTDTVAETILKQLDEKNFTDSTRLISSQEEEELSPSMSTLDAIAMDNVESALAFVPETAEQKSHDLETGPYISENLPEEMDEFVTLMRNNFHKGKKLVRRKIDTYADARHICARLLSANTHNEYNEIIVAALGICLNDNDELLRKETAESLSQISLKDPTIGGLNNTFGKLITLLDSEDRDMRLACIHAISHSGNRAALPHLLNNLSDEDYMVRLHTIHGLVYIITNQAKLNKAQQQAFMVLDEVSDETIISALFTQLDDKNYSVSMAAIEALTELEQKNAIELFIDVALSDEGQSAKRISKLLKKLDKEKSTELLLTRLDNVSDSSYRRYVMEMLEVIISPQDELDKAA
jgi:HEAT repeat protein